MRAWFNFRAQADAGIADVYIYDVIGASFFDDGVTASAFVADLAALPESVKTIRVHVNSPGGDPFEATTIANALRAQQTDRGRVVDVRIEGLAASAASIITSAGNPIRMAENALVMIHDPYQLTIGNAGEHRRIADALDKVRDAIVATYKWRSSKSEDQLRAMMEAETWMDVDEAIANGFATERLEEAEDRDNVAAAARFGPTVLARLRAPARIAAKLQVFATPPPARPVVASALEIVQACRVANCSELAELLIQDSASPDQVKTRVQEARAIKTMCERAHMNSLADGYIAARVPEHTVRAHLVAITAALDGGVNIDGGLDPDAGVGRRKGPALDIHEIYRQRNAAVGAQDRRRVALDGGAL